jgi:tetratricopeptide (TPR) repeat protein
MPEPEQNAAAPQDPAIHRNLADVRRAAGDELGAQAHLIAAQTLEAHARGAPGDSLTELCKVATGYFMLDDHWSAERWYRLALTLDPNLAIAYQNLAAIHAGRGDMAQARACRERAYAIQRVFVESTGTPTRRLLILCAGGGSGNVPFETLLSGGESSRIKYIVDFASEEEDAQLPPFDLVFNAIGEPDVAAPLAGRLERFAARCEKPLLNAPAAVSRTQRQLLPSLLGDLDDVVIAACTRHEGLADSSAELADRLRRGAMALPVLVRPAASHGGQGLVRCETREALEDALHGIDGAHYLTAFRDCRSIDGHYRKYRIVFIDRRPFAYHLAISSHWMVHYFSAEMAEHPWKIEEERRFLEETAAVLGDRARGAIDAIGRRIDLDYAGVDFTLLPDGRVLVFEANATMLVHRERGNGPLAHRNPHVQRIVDAFEALQARRLASGEA